MKENTNEEDIAMLTVSHLTKRYGKTEACRDLNFTLEPGTVTVLLGPNGNMQLALCQG
jgi:ABC-2 type transport system ATP-binding protein